LNRGVTVLLLALLPCACAVGQEPVAVCVSIPPQAYLAERIGGSNVIVHVFVSQGQDPHTFQPTPKQLVTLGKARLYFKIGFPFETRILEKLTRTHRKLGVVDVSAGISRRVLSAHGDHGHDVERDPHVWMSPRHLKIIARNMATAMSGSDPGRTRDYEANLQKLTADLDAADRRLRDVLGPYKGERFFVFHPSFGYFGDEYGLEQVAVEVEGKAPTPRQIMELTRRARAENVRIIFTQPQFDRRSAQTVAGAIGGAVVPLDPLAKDVLDNLERIGAEIRKSLDSSPSIR